MRAVVLTAGPGVVGVVSQPGRNLLKVPFAGGVLGPCVGVVQDCHAGLPGPWLGTG